jgi:UDP-N-acetylglucosamine 2-epimerase (non-hydrolysing)
MAPQSRSRQLRLASLRAIGGGTVAELHVLVVYGTRPEAIKLAPVAAECRRRGNLAVTVCFTGQHEELVRPIADYFGLCPDVRFAVMEKGQPLARLTARMLDALDSVVTKFTPDCVVAQGDTTTVLCTALVAFYRRTPLVHVEAGLRSGDLNAPWPEEINRRIASLATTLHCAPTQRARENLLAERVPPADICVTGNTVIDALFQTIERERANGGRWQAKHPELGDHRMVLITGHRRENHGSGLEAICAAVVFLAERFKNVEFLYAVHLNPLVCEPVRRLLGGRSNIHLISPVAYPEFVWLMDRSTLIITDSGGIQEEGPSLGKPVIVTRDCTERPEAVKSGYATLVGSRTDDIVQQTTQILEGRRRFPRGVQNVYGDGHAAERIVARMIERLSSGRKPLMSCERIKGEASDSSVVL